jgi:hypothetical protein
MESIRTGFTYSSYLVVTKVRFQESVFDLYHSYPNLMKALQKTGEMLGAQSGGQDYFASHRAGFIFSSIWPLFQAAVPEVGGLLPPNLEKALQQHKEAQVCTCHA